MHPAAFYFSCTYTDGISLRIVIEHYIITQALINETAFIGFAIANPICNCNLKQFHSLISFDYCTILKITEN